ncbi:hypothetical protein [Halopiger goleimassiliensis]|uniref:hypothetical protein n=1 Tax=Halopiger goleimassiliensis TaxID=1293048 RepID=UPI000677E794|nr:hypothetical protein [Halopiger goleimassiliensis]
MERRIERSFRGITERLAVRYLTNLGGERVAEDRVRGDGWVATLTSRSVEVGPSLSVTEVTLVFEGEAETVEPLVEQFERKAMRAGG